MNSATRRAFVPGDEAISDGIPASFCRGIRDHHGMFVVVLDILGRPPARMAAPVGKLDILTSGWNGITGDVVFAGPVQLHIRVLVADGAIFIPVIMPALLGLVR